MNNAPLTDEALDYLSKLLAIEVSNQVREGRGDQPMPQPWTELHTLTVMWGR